MDDVPTPPELHRKKRSPQESEKEDDSIQDKSLSSSSSSQDKPTYYMLTPALPEDKELRNKLWNNRLVCCTKLA